MTQARNASESKSDRGSTSASQPNPLFRVLSLDGGGAKGIYTLGVLKEVESLLHRPVCEGFDLIFGTSTGAIITALIALGRSVDQIRDLYRSRVVEVMAEFLPRAKSAALQRLASDEFGDQDFSAFKTNVGIVCTRWQFEQPMIFKTNIGQAHGRSASFVPGFGCKIKDVVEASCSAYPFFRKKTVKTSNDEEMALVDGGFCANNPTLYAIADATKALKIPPKRVRVVSVGVGEYPTPVYGVLDLMRLVGYVSQAMTT